MGFEGTLSPPGVVDDGIAGLGQGLGCQAATGLDRIFASNARLIKDPANMSYACRHKRRGARRLVALAVGEPLQAPILERRGIGGQRMSDRQAR
jgi:hypothetical protein